MLATADLALKRGHAIDDARTTDPDAIFLPVRFGECAAGLARVMRVRSDATVERSAPRTVIV